MMEILQANPDVVVIVDEAYVDFGGKSALPLLKKYENLLVVQTFSKSRAMAGMRIGFCIGNEKLIHYLNDVKFSFNSYTMNLPSQVMGVEAVKDVKYVLSSHYQGTPYDPYASYGDKTMCGAYRSIGINRNDVMTLIQMRQEGEPIQWLAFASNAFNVLAPFYTDIDTTPGYLSGTTGKVSTQNFYWMSRMIAAMADASYSKSVFHIERYQESIAAKSHELLNRYDTLLEQETDEETRKKIQEEANEKIGWDGETSLASRYAVSTCSTLAFLPMISRVSCFIVWGFTDIRLTW